MAAGIFTTRIKELKEMGKDLRHFHLQFDPPAGFDFKAGQFVNFLIQFPEKLIKRSYSIASPPSWKGSIDFALKRVEGGVVTNYLWNLKVGDTLTVQGPLGRFSWREPLPKDLIFISTGTGIAPFRSMIHELLLQNPPCQVWNIFGNRFEDEILYRDEFEMLAKKYPQFRNIFTVSRPKTWKGENAYVQVMLKKYITDAKDKHIFICGLNNMIQEVIKTATEIGFQKEQIFFEKYD